MIMAIQVRKAMEDFHVRHLTDKQMAELNPIIRQAIFDTIVLFEDSDHPDFFRRLTWLIAMIPSYWEVPNAGDRITDRAPEA